MRNESLIDLARIRFYPSPKQLSTTLLTMDSYQIDNLFVTRVEDRTRYSGIVGNGPYPSSQEVSGLTPIDDGSIDSIGIDFGPTEGGLPG